MLIKWNGLRFLHNVQLHMVGADHRSQPNAKTEKKTKSANKFLQVIVTKTPTDYKQRSFSVSTVISSADSVWSDSKQSKMNTETHTAILQSECVCLYISRHPFHWHPDPEAWKTVEENVDGNDVDHRTFSAALCARTLKKFNYHYDWN